MFCAGADLTITDAERAAVSDLVYECCETIITRPGPVIAVLTGPAAGGGAQLGDAAGIAAGIAADLAGTGTGAGECGIKAVMAAGGLLDRLRAERSANRSAWARAMAAAPAS